MLLKFQNQIVTASYILHSQFSSFFFAHVAIV